jgi:hypothetical protein
MFTISFVNRRPELVNTYRESNITNEEKEKKHYAGHTYFDGIADDLSYVFLVEIYEDKYNALLTKFNKISDQPKLSLNKYIRDVCYTYSPIGRYVVVEILDNLGNVIERII